MAKEIAEAVGGVILQGKEEAKVLDICIDSREAKPGDLFVPIIGERVDAHKFIPDVFAKGAACSFSSHGLTLPDGSTYTGEGTIIGVDNTEDALQKLGSWYRDRFEIPVVGVTGSVGKTTTKEMVSAALSAKFHVRKTPGNFNSLVGLPVTVLGITSEHSAAVIEMGISERGEMEKLSVIAKPKYGVMTNIGVSHIAQLKTRENIRKEKANIVDSFSEGSVLFVCGDDPLLREIAEHWEEIDLDEKTKEILPKIKIVTYGQNLPADYFAEQIVNEDDRTSFVCVGPNGSVPVQLHVLGAHNVNNALAAIAVAEAVGISMEDAAAGVGGYEAFRMRGQIHQVNGMKLIDDTYNASPDSMKSGLKMVTSLSDCTKTAAVLADVLELGEQSDALHEEVGAFIAKETSLDLLVTVGHGGSCIAKGARENLEEGRDLEIHSFEDKQGAIAFLKEKDLRGYGVLVKGSRGMAMEEVVKSFT